MTESVRDHQGPVAEIDDEQLPVPEHRTHGPVHFLGLYGAEHVAATEFVIGAAFVAMGATIGDILIGLLIGNTLAAMSFWLITAPIAVDPANHRLNNSFQHLLTKPAASKVSKTLIGVVGLGWHERLIGGV